MRRKLRLTFISSQIFAAIFVTPRVASKQCSWRSNSTHGELPCAWMATYSYAPGPLGLCLIPLRPRPGMPRTAGGWGMGGCWRLSQSASAGHLISSLCSLSFSLAGTALCHSRLPRRNSQFFFRFSIAFLDGRHSQHFSWDSAVPWTDLIASVIRRCSGHKHHMTTTGWPSTGWPSAAWPRRG